MEISYESAFEDAVPQSFASIVSYFGFSVTRVKEWMYELRSQNCLVEIFLDRQQVLVDVKPVRPDQVTNGRHFRGLGLGIIINCLDPSVRFRYRSIAEPERTVQETDRLAALLRQYCSPMLEGDFSELPKLMECREKGTWRTG